MSINHNAQVTILNMEVISIDLVESKRKKYHFEENTRESFTSSVRRFLYCGNTRRSANSMYEQGTDSVKPSENLKEMESATVEL